MLAITHISLPVILAACLGTSSAVIANALSVVMVGKINERLPDNERISYFWWGTEVRRRFKQLYPRNRLIVVVDSCVVAMVLSFIVLIRFWVFG